MTRSEQIFIFPLVVFPVVFAVNRGSWRRAVAWLALAMVVLLVVIAPWTIFNLGRFQRPVLLSNGFGPAVAEANCGPAYYGPEIGYGELSCLYPFYQGDQSINDGKYLHNGIHYAEGHISRLPVVIFAREGRAFGFWNPVQQTRIDAEWMGSWVGITPDRNDQLLVPASACSRRFARAPPQARAPVPAPGLRARCVRGRRTEHRRPALSGSRGGPPRIARGDRDRQFDLRTPSSLAPPGRALAGGRADASDGCRVGPIARIRVHPDLARVGGSHPMRTFVAGGRGTPGVGHRVSERAWPR